MEAKELRIGNIVTYKQDLYEVFPDGTKATVIPKEAVRVITPSDIQASKLYAPIPLTEEWLLKFGFNGIIVRKASIVDYEWNIGGVVLHQVENTFYHPSMTGKSGGLKHVHQLQNLYFALTGEELETGNLKVKE